MWKDTLRKQTQVGDRREKISKAGREVPATKLKTSRNRRIMGGELRPGQGRVKLVPQQKKKPGKVKSDSIHG